MHKIKTYAIIFITVCMSLVLASILSNTLFVDNSPVVNPIIARIFGINNAKYMKDMLLAKLKAISSVRIGQGVYAKTQDNNTYQEVNFNEVVWKEYTYNVKMSDGTMKEIKIKIPSDQIPPSAEDLQKTNSDFSKN